MNTKTIIKQNKTKDKKVTFICHHCQDVGLVYIESWNQNSDGPFQIELVHHEDLVAMVAEVIELKKERIKKVFKYAYCVCCNSLLQAPIDTVELSNKMKKTMNRKNL